MTPAAMPEHFRFTTTQGRGTSAALLAQAGESSIGALDAPGDACSLPPEDPRAQLQVLLHGQVRKNVRALRGVADPQPFDRMRRETLKLTPVKDNAPLEYRGSTKIPAKAVIGLGRKFSRILYAQFLGG